MDRARYGVLILLCAIGTSGCNTTASRQLALAIDSYDSLSREAIGSLETIEAEIVEEPPVPDSEAEQRFVREALASGVDFTNRRVMNSLFRPNPVHVRNVPALAEMRCQHGRFRAAFTQLEEAGIFGKRPVAAHAPAILDALVAQQLAMARLVGQPAYTTLLTRRAAAAAELRLIVASSESAETKAESIAEVRRQLVAIEEEEAQLREAALEDLLKAAATGIALREQITQYGEWSLSDLIDSLEGLSGFLGEISGEDLTKLNGRIDELEGLIAQDPRMALVLQRAVGALPTFNADGTLADAPPARPRDTSTETVSVSGTPCLDQLPGGGLLQPADPEPPAEPDQPPTPAAPAAAAPQPPSSSSQVGAAADEQQGA